MKQRRIAALGTLWLLLAAHGAWTQAQPDSAVSPLPPGIAIRAEASPKIATVGDRIRIDLDITMPQGYTAEVPKPDANSPDISILDFLPGPAIAAAGKSSAPAPAPPGAPIHHQASIVVAIYKTGKFVFPAIPVKITTADGKEILAKSSPIDIEIKSILTDKNPELNDLKKQAEIPEPTRWLLWIGIAAAACLLGAIAWYLWKRRRKGPEPLTPAQTQSLLDLAEADLRNLIARGFPERGWEKQYYVLLSDIVRRILEAGYGIHAEEQTTSEIMDALFRLADPDSENRARIESFLVHCDVVKFAKYIPSRTEQETAAQDALHILAEARKTVGSRCIVDS
jgi:LPXTG-motif cell wall-anchored protein